MSTRRIAMLIIVPTVNWAVVTAGLVLLGRPPAPAAALALVPAAFFAAGTVAADLMIRDHDVPSVTAERIQTASWAAMFASVAALALDTLHVPYGLAIGVLSAVPAWFWFGRTTADTVAIGTQKPVRPDSLASAHRQVEACRRQLRDRRMAPPRRAWVKYNLVTALTQTASMSGDAAGLLEAISVLEELLADTTLAPDQRYLVASELSDTMSMLASLGGDAEGWPEALDRQLAIAHEQPAGTERQAALMTAHDARVQQHMFHLSRLPYDENGDRPAEFEEHLDAALAGVGDALAAAPPGSPMIAHLRMERGVFLLERDPDDAVRLLREVHEETRRRPMVEHENIQLSYAMGLLRHAMTVDPEEGLADLDEAERLAREIATRGQILGGQAAEMLAEIGRTRTELGEGEDLGRQFREAYERQRGNLVTDASRVALSWAEWAEGQADARAGKYVDEAAEAYEAVVREFAIEVARRTDPEEIARHSASMQGVAAEAGYWLVRAGRVADAVNAVESARALLLSSRVQRLPADLAARLRAAGRGDLLDRLTAAEQALDAAERVQYDGIPTTTPGAVSTVDRRAWLEFRVARREIDEALHLTADARPVTWDPALGRLVYLAAARRAGYALIVDGAGARAVELPTLTAERLERSVRNFQRLLATDEPDRWRTLLDRLGAAVMSPVTRDLRAGADLVVVPLGGLALLPLHAARTDRGHLDAWVNVRYAPNARLFLEAARHPGPPPATALVAAADPGDLPQAEAEARWVAGRLPGAELLERAGLEDVLARLERADVWHFACHGVADPAEPLDSAVFLTDAPLRLRHLLGRAHGRHRLAVLSACQTGVPDPGRLDEVVSLPGALLRAGVAGVVATQWSIEDAAAALVVRRFYDLWLAGSPPHAALAGAQRWLREATLGEIAGAQGKPGGHGDRWARKPYADKPWAWAAFTYTGA